MLPTVDEALYELKLAEDLNPGPWVRHSINVGIAARNIAEKVSWLDPEKAYIVGLLHDIGRRVSYTDHVPLEAINKELSRHEIGRAHV